MNNLNIFGVYQEIGSLGGGGGGIHDKTNK